MVQYRLSVGSVMRYPEISAFYDKPPVHMVSYRHLSDVLNSPDEVRYTAKALFDTTPLVCGLTLRHFQHKSLEAVLRNPTSIRVESTTILAYSDAGFDTDCLLLEVMSRPFYGVIYGKTWYYKDMAGIYNSKYFRELRSSISYKAFTQKINSHNAFEFSVSGVNRMCFKYQGVEYREQEQIP